MIHTTSMKRSTTDLSEGFMDYQDSLKNFASYKTRNEALADDLVQATFLKTWMYLVRGGKISHMKAFLFHVMKALIIDEYRKRKAISLDLLCEKGFEPSGDDSKRHVEYLDGKDALAMIPSLPLKYQQIVRLRYVDDLSITEVASVTHQTRNAVTVQSHRGLAKLKVLYAIHTHTE